MLLKNFPVFKGDGPYIPVLIEGLIRTLYFRPSYPKMAGWQGIRHSSLFGHCWSAKIIRHQGVFGFEFKGEKSEAGFVCSSFMIYYFPYPDEKLVEVFPLATLSTVQKQNYSQIIGNFPSLGQDLDYFQTGSLEICAGLSGEWMQMTISAFSRQRVRSRHGLSLPDGRWLVKPGEYESDVPAWLLSYAFFRSLATSVSIVLDHRPEPALISRYPGKIMEITRNSVNTIESSQVARLSLSLNFGKLPQDISVPAKGFYIPRNFRMQPWQNPFEGGGTQLNQDNYRPDFVIFSGFLGSGKTTLIRDLLDRQMQKNYFTAVIQNEIGKENLDGKLLKGECELEEIDEGCVCCTLSGQIRRGVSRIMDRFKPDLIILETSGLANPKNITEDYKSIQDLVKPGPLITVVDALNFERVIEKSMLARDQVMDADIIIIAKADLVQEHIQEKLIKRIRKVNLSARIFIGQNGRVNWSDLLRFNQDNKLNNQAPSPPFTEDKEILPEMRKVIGLNHADEGFETRTLYLTQSIDRDDLLRTMEKTGPGVYRIKGIVDLRSEDTPFLVHKAGEIINLEPLSKPRTDKRFLVFIGQGLDQENLDLKWTTNVEG